MSPKTTFRIARVYDEVRAEDGERILVDRVWPRGFRKDDPRVGHWYKDAAPSDDLRRWYNHQPERFAEFVSRYEHELRSANGATGLAGLRALARGKATVTLVTASRDVQVSQAAVLAKLLAASD
ncbi:hypothetical protein AWC18_11440 [Mycolicibacter nonchromogenicus]|uniref:MarR family transcriptional regulator n=1 Tax=Mycolicibacter nonchromogenicus TaxID=1782 RepID=A0A1X1ZBB3_MYCNO|nr:DUF488 family protein [Mycolicibacter nonchromogenicus]ORW20697.1 hypothetical protein AWC18_11440 [Mycolicibacter nonchromogenicus]